MTKVRQQRDERSRAAFDGKTALVTGGASGIGRALGRRLAELGATVVLADIDGGAAQAAAETIGRDVPNSRVSGRTLDVRDEAAFRSLVAEVDEPHGGLDFLFSNAGISIGGPTHELSRAHWDRIIDINLGGVVNGLLAAYPGMVERGRGHIVNTASGAGLMAPPFVTPYASTKYAVVGLSTGLRSEAALHGVRVSVLCPGAVETAILDRTPDGDLPETTSETVTARAYLRTVGQRPMSADRFARSALDQVARNSGLIVVPTSAKSLWWLQRLSPRATDAISRVIARRVQRRLVHPRS